MLTPLDRALDLHRPPLGIGAAPPHRRGIRRRGRGEHLHLLGGYPQFVVAEPAEIAHVVVGAARMGRDEVVCEVLVPAETVAGRIEHALEPAEDVASGLPHQLQDIVAHVLRCDLHLTGDVLRHQHVEVLVALPFIGDDHVVPYPGVHEDPPDPVDVRYGAQEVDLDRMVDPQLGAGTVQASPVLASPHGAFLPAFDAVHVGRRSPDVLDDAVETLLGGHPPDLCEDGLLGTGDDGGSLMGRYGAEGAVAVAPAMGGDGVPDGLHRLDLALLGVVGVDGVLEIRPVCGVQLLGRHAAHGPVLDEPSVAVPLAEGLRRYGIRVPSENLERLHERPAVLSRRHLLVRREAQASLGFR